MEVLIKKDNHYSSDIERKLIINKDVLSKLVIFTDDCRYNLHSEDQNDINKLFGIGYFPYHHYNSVRFGWAYNLQTDKIDIFAYWYSNRIRNYNYLVSVDINSRSYYSMFMEKNNHVLEVYNQKEERISSFEVPVKKRFIGYYLNPFFGGNRKAPQDITIKIYEDVVFSRRTR